MTSCIGVLKYISYVTYHIFKYDCIIVHKAYYLFTCTCVSINSFHSHSHSNILGDLNFLKNVEIFSGFVLIIYLKPIVWIFMVVRFGLRVRTV